MLLPRLGSLSRILGLVLDTVHVDLLLGALSIKEGLAAGGGGVGEQRIALWRGSNNESIPDSIKDKSNAAIIIIIGGRGTEPGALKLSFQPDWGNKGTS